MTRGGAFGAAVGAVVGALLCACAAAQPLTSQPPLSASYPEGPLWVEASLFVPEMGADQVSVIRDGAKTAFWRDPGCGPTSIAVFGAGFVIACHLRGDLALLTGEGELIGRIGADAGVPIRNPNDMSADGRGGVFFSDPGPFNRGRQPVGRVVWLDPNGRLHEVDRGLAYPNGVLVDRSNPAAPMLYVTEHFTRRIWRYPLMENGSLGVRQLWTRIPEPVASRTAYFDLSGPDGLERGPDGAVYVALYGEGRVVRLDGEGRLTGEHDAPPFVTNVAFGKDPQSVTVVGAFLPDRPPFTGAIEQVALEAFR